MKEKILKLFFENGYTQKRISEELNISKGYVSQVVTKNIRYGIYKEQKLINSRQKHNKQIQKKVEENRKKVQFKNAVDDLVLKKMHNQATLELSKKGYLTNESYRKWNSSAYRYNPSKKRYEFDDNLGRSYDVPKYIKER